VLPDLPGKREETRFCDLSSEQAALYREVLAQARKDLLPGLADRGRRVEYIPILAAITRLKRICDHPALALPEGRGADLPSGKLDLFREVLDGALAAGRKVVVFTQYLEMMDLLAREARARGAGVSTLRGATRDREAAVAHFQRDPACRVMVVSLLAGGVGIDLTEGSVVVHYDRWWNAAREDQATDRVHRIGQTREVEVVRLVTRGTVEEKIDALIAARARLLDDLVEAEAGGLLAALDRSEIASLFG
jgi:SNF2 family DNA or RNA helicase